MIGLMRLILAASGLTIIYVVPSEPDRDVALTYTALAIYTVYSAAVFALGLRDGGFLRSFPDWGHWVDVGCYTILISLSSGTNSIFFFGYFFAILTASFRWGFASGIRVVAVSTLLFTTVGFLTSPPEPEFELQRSVIRPVYLLVLGYMIAYWGGSMIQLNRRLALLKEVGNISNPRFGVDRTLGLVMKRLMEFFQADDCLLITIDPLSGAASLRRSSARDPEGAAQAEPIPSSLAGLLAPPIQDVIIYSRHKASLPGRDSMESDAQQQICEGLAAVLDVQSFLSASLSFRQRISGRLYLTAGGRRRFNESEGRFLQQAIEHALPLIDNILLVNQLASAAAEEERRRIARDIHDSVIQPYIGLQIGLAGLGKKLAESGSELSADVERLMEMTSLGIADLRRNVASLKTAGGSDGSLVPAVSRFAEKFSEVAGIQVQVIAETDVQIEDQLAAEVFQMVAEGLSNIRKHTQASRARVDISLKNGALNLRIENDGKPVERPPAFSPRSIAERAASLGGVVEVQMDRNGSTVVSIEIPL